MILSYSFWHDKQNVRFLFVNHNRQQSCWRRMKILLTILFGESTWMSRVTPEESISRLMKDESTFHPHPEEFVPSGNTMNSKSLIEMEPLTDKHDSNEDELRPELVHAFFTHKSHTGPTRSEEAHEATLDPVSFTQTSKRLWMLNHTPFHKLKFIDDRLVGRGHSLFPGPGG